MKLRQYVSAALCLMLLVGMVAAVPVQAESKKIVCVGDSITEGIHFLNANAGDVSTDVFSNNYPKLVAEKLGYTLYNAGIKDTATVGAEKIGNVDAGLDWLTHSSKPDKIQYCDVLTIMLGTNDAPNWSLRKDLYKESYTAIVEAYRALNPDLELYVLTSPYTPNSNYKVLETDIVPLQKALAQELGGTLIDVYAYTKRYTIAYGDFIDSVDMEKRTMVHPSERGHQVMADIVYAGITGTDLPAYITTPTTTRKTTTKKTTITQNTTTTKPTAASTTKEVVTTVTSTATQVVTANEPTVTGTTVKHASTSLVTSTTSGGVTANNTTAGGTAQASETTAAMTVSSTTGMTTGDEMVALNAGLKLLASAGTFPERNTITISVKLDKTQSNQVTKALASFGGVTQFIPYDIISDNQPSVAVKAVFTIPEAYDPQKTALLYVSPEGKAERLPAVVDEESGTLTATLPHFSLYALVEGNWMETETQLEESTGMPLWVWLVISGMLVAALAAGVVMIVLKRKAQ